MNKVLIATIYHHYAVIASASKFSISELILLIDDKPNKTMQKNIKLIEGSLGSVMKIRKIQTELYDINSIATHIVAAIDSIHIKNEIYIDITAGRKSMSLGFLFAAYARMKRIKKICYVTEDTRKIIFLPRMSYSFNQSQREILQIINKNTNITTLQLSEKINLSRGLVYRYITELIEHDAIEKDEDVLILSDFGKIFVL